MRLVLSSGASLARYRAARVVPLPSCSLPARPLAARPAKTHIPRLFSSPSTLRLSSTTTTSKPKPYYCTTPIFYVNADPHIGHLHSVVLADVLARWHAISNKGWSPTGPQGDAPVTPILATGTDEHGLKIQKAAEAAGEEPRQLCDRVSGRFKDLADAAGANWTHFVRTTQDSHRVAVYDIWNRLQKNGHIYKGKHEGWYSVSDETFYPEQQVHEVTDPESGETYKASIETGKRVEWTSEENYKFRMSAFRDQLVAWLESNPDAILPPSRHEQILQEVKTNLEDLSISRPATRLTWCLPVPEDPSQGIYVWIDALVNYLTAEGFPWTEGQTSAWPADAHIVGKDIIRFHAIYWPCILLAAGLPLPKSIITHAHWTKDKMKISKSTGNVVDPFYEIQRFGKDAVRFYLCKMGGNLEKDSDYSEMMFSETHNKWLAGQLGNLVGRVCGPALSGRIFSAVHQRPFVALDEEYQGIQFIDETEQRARVTRPTGEDVDQEIEEKIQALGPIFAEHLKRAELSRAIDAVFDLLRLINWNFSFTRPWHLVSCTKSQALATVYYTVETLRIVEILLRSILPDKMKDMRDVMGFEEDLGQRDFKDVITLQKHVTVSKREEKIGILFPPNKFKQSSTRGFTLDLSDVKPSRRL